MMKQSLLRCGATDGFATMGMGSECILSARRSRKRTRRDAQDITHRTEPNSARTAADTRAGTWGSPKKPRAPPHPHRAPPHLTRGTNERHKSGTDSAHRLRSAGGARVRGGAPMSAQWSHDDQRQLERIAIELRDIRTDIIEDARQARREADEVRIDLELLMEAVARTAYDLGLDHPGRTVTGCVNALIGMSHVADSRARAIRARAIRAVVAAQWGVAICSIVTFPSATRIPGLDANIRHVLWGYADLPTAEQIVDGVA